MYSALLVLCLPMLALSGPPGQASDEPVSLRLGREGNPIGYQLERVTEVDSARASTFTQYFSLSCSPDSHGTKISITIARLTVMLRTQSGDTITIDTARKETYESSSNPVVRTMVDGIEEIIGPSISCVVDSTGKIVDQSGVERIRTRIPGRGIAPGLPAQVLSEFTRSATQIMELLPPQAIRIGESWTSPLTVQLGPSAATRIPVKLILRSRQGDLARVEGEAAIDPALISSGFMGEAVAAKARVEYVFDTVKGLYCERNAVVWIELERSRGKNAHLMVSRGERLQDPAGADRR